MLDVDSADFALPGAVLAVALFVAVASVAYQWRCAARLRPTRLAAVLAKWADRLSPTTFPLALAVMWLILVALPVVTFILGAYLAFANVGEPVFGLSVLLLGGSIVLLAACAAAWARHGFRADATLRVLFSLCTTAVVAQLLVLAFIHRPLTFFSISAVALAVNMLPMIVIVFLHAESVRVDGDKFAAALDAQMRDGEVAQPADRLSLVRRHGSSTFVRGALVRATPPIIGLYALAVTILVVYGLLVDFVSDDNSGAVGFLTAAAVIVFDVAVVLARYSGLLAVPLATCVLLTAVRAFVISFGTRFWFIGHSIAYAIVASLIGVAIAKRHLVSSSKEERIRAALHGDAAEGGRSSTRSGPRAMLAALVPSRAGAREHAVGLLRHPVAVLVFLTIAFVVDLLLVIRTPGRAPLPKVRLVEEEQDQALFGVGALTTALVLPLAIGTLLSYRKNDWSLNRRTVALGVATAVVTAVGGFYIYAGTQSMIILLSGFFLPLALFLAVRTFVVWVKQDFDLYFVDEKLAAKLGVRKLRTNLATAIAAVLVFPAWGAAVSATVETRIIGLSIAMLPLLLVTTVVPIYRFFNTFVLSRWTFATLALAGALLLGYAASVWHFVFEWQGSQLACGVVIFMVFLYPVLTLLVTALVRWADEAWVMDRFVRLALGTAAALLLLFCAAVAAIFEPYTIGAGLLAAFLFIFYLIFIVFKWASNDFFLARAYRLSLVAVLAFLFVLGLTVGLLTDGHDFVGFSLSWLILAGVLLLFGIQSLVTRWRDVLFSRHVFPVFLNTSGRVQVDNRPTAALLVSFVMLLVWGTVASMAMTRTVVGVGLAGLAVLLLHLAVIFLTSSSAMRFGVAAVELDADVVSAIMAGGSVAGSAGGTGTGADGDEDSGNIVVQIPMLAETDVPLSDMLAERSAQVARRNAATEDVAERAAAEVAIAEIDERLDRVHASTARSSAKGVFGVIAAARMEQQRRDAQLNKLLREMGLADMTAADIASWDEENRRVFEAKKADWLAAQEAKEAEERRRELEDIQAAERRRREAAERRRRELEEAEARRRAEEEAWREAERRRLERENDDAEDVQRRLEAAEAARREAERRAAEEAAEAERRRLEAEEEALRRRMTGKKQDGGGGTDVHTLEPHVAEIVERVRSDGGPFSDDEFPAAPSSIGARGSDLTRVVSDWVRFGELPAVTDMALFKDGLDPSDICQGQVGDCYLLSAFSVLTLQPERVRNLIVDASQADQGLYVVQFFKDGRWVQIAVDDRMPVTSRGRLAFARSSDANEAWTSILEKAYAKLHTSFEAIEGGLVSDSLADLTGGTATDVPLKSLGEEELHDKMLEFKRADFLMGSGSHPGSDRNTSDLGIVQGHAYSILDVVHTDGHRLVKLRNPWGRGEWKGDWSDESPLWTRRMRAKLHFDDVADDGVFWMTVQDFVAQFRTLYVCRTFTNMHAVRVRSAWRGETAGGIMSNANGPKNPQFFVAVSRPTMLYVSLEQDETRGKRDDVIHIGASLLDKGGKRAKAIYVGEKVASSGSYTNKRSVTFECKVDGPRVYTLFVSTYDAGQENGFSVVVHSDHAVDVTEIPADHEAD